MSFKKDLNKKISKKLALKLGVSAGVVAGLTSFSMEGTQAYASEVHTIQDIRNLQHTYNSLENQLDQLSEEESQDEIQAIHAELDTVKAELVEMIELAGGSSLLAQVDISRLDSNDLDSIFEGLIEYKLEEQRKNQVDAQPKVESQSVEHNHVQDQTDQITTEDTAEPVEPGEADQEEMVDLDEVNNPGEAEDTEEPVEIEGSDREEPVEALAEDAVETVEVEEADQEETVDLDEVNNPVEVEDTEEPVEIESSDREELVEAPVEDTAEDSELAAGDQDEEVEAEEEVGTQSTDQEQAEEIEASSEEDRTEAQETAEDNGEEETSSIDPILYTIQTGDTLYSVANSFGTSVNQLTDYNNISNPNQIRVGQVLSINQPIDNLDIPIPQAQGNSSRITSSSAFINEIGEYARDVAAQNNLYASVMIAQASLESGYGQSQLASAPNYNLFGIKGSYNGESVAIPTREYSDSTGWVTIVDHFKKYPSYAESFQDNANLLRNGTSWDPYFYAGTWLENTDSHRDATDWLEGRYATDPSYASKLNNIIARHNLTQFDVEGIEDFAENPQVDENDSPIKLEENLENQEPAGDFPSSDQATTYTVRPGDTLYRIGQRFNTSVNQLQEWNNLSNPNLIVTGQTLQVSPAASTSQSTSTTSTSNNARTYTVRPGDTLYRIGQRFNTSVNQLQEWNNLSNPNLIVTGQTLQVSPAASTSQSTSTTSTSNSARTYTVRPGDTLYRIGQRFNTSVNQLQEWNNLSNPNLIVTGQTLQVSPAASTSQSTSTTSTSNNARTYTVRPGDTLYRIGQRFNTSVNQLQEWNNLSNPNLIVTGQTLQVSQPAPTNSSASQTTDTTASSPSEATTYTVRPGDTLYRIGQRFNTSVNQLQEWNNLSNPNLIVTGQTLQVSQPAPTNSSASQTTDTTASSPSEATTYTVRPGDTLYRIGQRFNTSVNQLQEWNDLSNPNLIVTGQTLQVSQADPSTSPGIQVGDEENSTESEEVQETVETVESPEYDASTYTVQSGDTLTKIARATGTSVDELKAINGLTSDLIITGQTLTVRAKEGTPMTSTSEEVVEPDPDTVAVTYTVKSGDTLYEVAQTYNTDVDSIVRWNNLTNPNVIITGQSLTIYMDPSAEPELDNNPANEDSNSQNSSSSTNIGAGTTHRVVAGDTLTRIARRYGTSVSELKALNGLTSDLIIVGQTLNVGDVDPSTYSNTSGWVRPANGYKTSSYGWRVHPIFGTRRHHNGLDIGGGGPIRAARAGTVTRAQWDTYGLGYYVKIDHHDGFETVYGHMRSNLLVSPGQWVNAGQRIGTMGTTGNSTGVHLHFEVHRNGRHVNPELYVNY